MKYMNISTERKLIPIGRVRTWVQPKEVVDLSGIDLQTMGSNSRFMKRVSQTTPVGLKKAEAPVGLKKAEAPVKKAPVEKAPVKKESIIKKAIKKVAKKKEPDAKELRQQRAELKAALEEMNKGELYAFGEDNLDIDLRFKDKKDVLVKRVLDASKKVGYKKILRKI